MGRHHDVGFPAGDLVRFGSPNDHGVGRDGNKLIQVSTEINFDHVSVLKDDIGVVGERREVTNAIVHGDAARERDSYEKKKKKKKKG